MGASTSAQQDAKSAEEERVADLSETRGGGDTEDAKQLQKNGQISISSLNGKTDEQTDLSGKDEDDILAEVGQTEAMPQKEDSPESVEVLQDEVSPQVNGEKEEKECVSADETTPTEEKVAEEKPTESNEVGFKKIFRFVGFKFTLKKDKNEKTEPVQLLTVKETEDGASESAVEEIKEEPVTAEIQSEDEKKPDVPEMEKEANAEDAAKTEAEPDPPATDAPKETKLDGAEETEKIPADEPTEEVETSEKEKEPEPQTESPTSPSSQETQSPFKRFFTQGIFSNLRKKTSFKKSKEEESVKEKSAEEDIKEDEEKEEAAAEGEGQVKEDAEKVETGEQVDKSDTPEKSVASPEEVPSAPEEQKEEELKVEAETTSEAAPVQEPEVAEQTTTCEISDTSAAEEKYEIKSTDDTKLTDDKATDSSEEQQIPEKSPAETTTEAEVQSSQDKAKAQGSPLKKLFTGAGLKKLSSKKQKGKKETESKQTESTEQAAEQIQSSPESGEAEKPDSGASSPEESGEHVVGEASQAEANVEAEGEAATSDSEKKKDGILHWASFKKLVTPKKRVKRSSESEDEAPGDKPKSATLSSTESAVFEEKPEEIKPNDEVKEEAKEEIQVELKTETKAEKTEQSTEEPKKKIDTSVSWEALICVGSAKKRSRKTSDSDNEETKIEEEVQQSGEEQAKTAESPLESSQEVEHENMASSPEPEGEPVSTWESFKRLVTQRKKPKVEDKSDEAQGPEQAVSDSELPKEESSFSLRKLIPRRKKKSDAKQGQVSSDVGSAEEDSDTPAVVPLSEYDNEQSEKATDEETNTAEAKPAVTPVTPGKASAEDRSPSWISATVENVEDDAEGKPLSDIPEEGDTAATPKSTDNTIAEDIIEITSEAITAIEPAEETEMVSALSRITESPVTSGETSPVPVDGVVKKAGAILQEAVETISITSSAVAVTVTEEQTTSIAVTTSPFQIESAIKEEKLVLAVHEKSEAIAICTGLDTSEIKAVEEGSLLKAAVEAVTTVTEALSVEVVAEDQTIKPEEAEAAEDKVFVAQVNEVQTECKEQSPASVENTVQETSEGLTTNEFQKATAVEVAVVTAMQQEIEILEEPVVAENTPKVTESPVQSTLEQPACAQTVEVTEVTAAEGEVQEIKDVKESVASDMVEPVEVAVAVSEEVTASLADTTVAETTTSQEDPIPVLAATEEPTVTEEIVCVCPPSESKTETEVKDEVVMESVLTSQVHSTTCIEVVSESFSVEGNTEVASSSVSTVIEEAYKKDEEDMEAMHLKEAEAIQEQSTVIVQEVLQNVVENLSEMHMGQELEEKPVEEIDTAKAEEVPSAPEEEKLSQDAPIAEEKIIVDTQTQEEPKPETEKKGEEELTQIITERLPVSEAIQISEVVLVAMTEEIKTQEEEVPAVSVEEAQLCTDVVKQEVELKEGEKAVEEDKTVTTESEDGKCQVEKGQNEEPSGATETLASEESCQTQTATLVSTKQAEIVEEESKTTQDMKMETTMEINVGIIHVVDADERAKQDTEIVVIEDSTKSQEPSKDVPQTDLEEAQKDISAPDMKGQEGSGDPVCQKTDAETSEVKTAAEETPKPSKEEDVEKEIDTITTETATES